MSHVVVLNASYEPLGVVTIRRAVIYVLKERAEIVESVPGRVYRAASGDEFPVPLIVRFKTMIKVPYLYREQTWTRRGLFARDNYTCGYCSRVCAADDATVDHIVPRSQGGEYTGLNTVTACIRCNGKKANRTPTQAHMPLKYQPRAVFQRERLLIAIANTGADLASLGLAAA